MTEFKKADKVYSIFSGWGVVVDIDNKQHRPIVCTFFRGDAERFHYDGKGESYDLVPTIYKHEVKIVEA